jgi:hypothetical protein
VTAEQERIVRAELQQWADLEGHDRCHWHPEILTKLCRVLGIAVLPKAMPSRKEFEEGCRLYADGEYLGSNTT